MHPPLIFVEAPSGGELKFSARELVKPARAGVGNWQLGRRWHDLNDNLHRKKGKWQAELKDPRRRSQKEMDWMFFFFFFVFLWGSPAHEIIPPWKFFRTLCVDRNACSSKVWWQSGHVCAGGLLRLGWCASFAWEILALQHFEAACDAFLMG